MKDGKHEFDRGANLHVVKILNPSVKPQAIEAKARSDSVTRRWLEIKGQRSGHTNGKAEVKVLTPQNALLDDRALSIG